MNHLARIARLALVCCLALAPAAAWADGPVRTLTMAGEHGNLVGKLQQDAPRTYSFTGTFTLSKASRDKYRDGAFKIALVFLKDGVKVEEVEVPLRKEGEAYLVDRYHFRTCCEFTRVSYVLK